MTVRKYCKNFFVCGKLHLYYFLKVKKPKKLPDGPFSFFFSFFFFFFTVRGKIRNYCGKECKLVCK